MNRFALKLFILAMTLVSSASAQCGIDMFIMDFPHGERRIHVKQTGEAYLYYGAKPSAQIITKGTFSVAELYDTFKPFLHQNLPREQWPDPQSQAGLVTVGYINGEEEDYLIFDLQALAGEIFETAEKNISGELTLAAFGSDSAPEVAVELLPSAIVIKNNSQRTICYAIHEKNSLTLIEWGPVCLQNNQVGPQKSAIELLKNHNFNPSGEAIVSWWFKGDNGVKGDFHLNVLKETQRSQSVSGDKSGGG